MMRYRAAHTRGLETKEGKEEEHRILRESRGDNQKEVALVSSLMNELTDF